MKNNLFFSSKINWLTHFFLLFCSTQSYCQWISQGPNGQSLSSINFYDANLGYACGSAGSLYRTLDGGTTWTSIPNFQTPGLQNRLRSVIQPSRNTVLVIFETPTQPEPTTTHISTNSGFVFNVQHNGTFRTMSMRDPTFGIMVGDNGTLRLTFSGANLWNPVASGTQQTLRDGDCPTNQDCYAVGDNGTVRKNIPGNLFSWRAVNSTTSARLNGVWFTDALRGCIVGDGGIALRTVDGGITWTRILLNTNVNLYDVRFLTPNVGFIAGDLGTVLLTTDGGVTWQAEATNTFETLYSITATADGANTWIAGDGGTVLKRGAVVLSSSRNALTSGWEAYPNPFANNITLDIPRTSARNIKARLLNVTGQVIFEQDLSGLAGKKGHVLLIPAATIGGVYFLQLLLEDKTIETRRLVRLP